jgi:ABC-type Zn uptake system ZnuABC Zn-binding protein ZnuA
MFMKTIFVQWTLALLLVGVTSAEAKLNVVATTGDLGALAQAIGGKEVEITVLARPTEDPHFVDPKPSFIVRLNRADALIEGGAELESSWLGPLVAGARNARISPGGAGSIHGNDGVAMLEVPETADRSQGDIHAAGNPHYLVDPENARIAASQIAEVFCRLDPASSGTYRANLQAFQQRLDAKIVDWKKTLEPFKGSRIVAYHNSWPYFARRFGLEIELFLEPKPGIPPSPAHLAGVIGKMREQNARVIFVDPYQSRRTAVTVANSTGATVVSVTQYPGGVKGTEGGYIEMMDYIVQETARALGRNR